MQEQNQTKGWVAGEEALVAFEKGLGGDGVDDRAAEQEADGEGEYAAETPAEPK